MSRSQFVVGRAYRNVCVAPSIFEYLRVSLSIFLLSWTGDMSRFDESSLVVDPACRSVRVTRRIFEYLRVSFSIFKYLFVSLNR